LVSIPQRKELTFFSGENRPKKRFRTVRSAELKEFEREVSLKKMYPQRVRFFSNNLVNKLRDRGIDPRSGQFVLKALLTLVALAS
jgi:hypothetical protein